MFLLTSFLPDALVATLLFEWIDPEHDLQIVLQAAGWDSEVIRRLAAPPGMVLRAFRVLSDDCLEWLASCGVRVALLETVEEDWMVPGAIVCCTNGKLHRDDDGPAWIGPGGTGREWYQHGELVRVEGRSRNSWRVFRGLAGLAFCS